VNCKIHQCQSCKTRNKVTPISKTPLHQKRHRIEFSPQGAYQHGQPQRRKGALDRLQIISLSDKTQSANRCVEYNSATLLNSYSDRTPHVHSGTSVQPTGHTRIPRAGPRDLQKTATHVSTTTHTLIQLIPTTPSTPCN
jgi:hypothetical protein